jgi:hypothetical protein
MTNSPERLDVTNGPSREELFDALRLRHERRTVTFVVQTGPGVRSVVRARVNAIANEDCSGKNWLVKLYDHTATLRTHYLDVFSIRGVERVGSSPRPTDPVPNHTACESSDSQAAFLYCCYNKTI